MRNIRVVWYWVLLIASTLAAYANTLDAPFILDDLVHVVNEPLIRPPLELTDLLAHPRPLVAATFCLNYWLAELDVAGYHLLNIVAHLMCGGIVFGLARETLRFSLMSDRYEGHADALAAVIAAIFLLHPIQTESVTYVSQRAEVLAGTAFLASMLLAARAIRAPRDSRTRQATAVLLIVLGLAGMLSKSTVIVLPAAVAVYHWCFLTRGGVVRAISGQWQLYALLVAISCVTAIHAAPSLSSSKSVGFDIAGLSWWEYLGAQCGVVVYYLRLIFLPDNLCFACGHNSTGPVLESVLGSAVVLPAVALLAICGASALVRSRYPAATFAVWASLVVLAPTSTVIPLSDWYVEHRLYLPIAFVSMLFVLASFDFTEWVDRRTGLGASRMSFLRTTAALVLCVLLGTMTFFRNEIYREPIELWRHTVAQVPGSWRAQYQLARQCKWEGRYESAVEHYDAVIAILGRHAPLPVHVGLANSYTGMSDFAGAAEAYERALTQHPDTAMVYRNLTDTYFQLKRREDALAAARRAVELEPQNLRGRKLLGGAYALVDRLDAAIREYEAAARIAPGDASIRQQLEVWRQQARGRVDG